ncbi:unnamed protein product [marine sediment metagenome]|uniref:Uncharacterized protein n=1 Tax=marine sediment metagenome TaxID=412755 RepID=X1LZD2_9ZZZZ
MRIVAYLGSFDLFAVNGKDNGIEIEKEAGSRLWETEYLQP